MFQIRVVKWADRFENQALLERYFRMRHDIYVVGRQWQELERPVRMEIDAFDNPHAIYLIGVDEDANIVAGSRLIPTLRPHLMANVFPELAIAGPPRNKTTYEWTRFFVAPHLKRMSSPSVAAGRMMCAVLEFCAVAGVKQITIVCEAFWPERLSQLGWRYEQLGDVLNHRDGDIVGISVAVSCDILQRTKEAYGLPLDQPMIVDTGKP